MTPELLDELERLEKAATPKEWRVKNVNESKFDYMWGPEYKPVFYIEAGHGLGEGGNSPTESNLVNITPKQVHMSEGDVKLIVALRNAAPSLIQSLRSLMAENEALKKEREEREKTVQVWIKSDYQARDYANRLEAQFRLAVEALEGFSKYCIKPECKCWACEALAKLGAAQKEGG